VLPFTNLSDDPKQDYFSDGISDQLINDLSRLPGLFVRAQLELLVQGQDRAGARDRKGVGSQVFAGG
jgi:TolB-like protein